MLQPASPQAYKLLHDGSLAFSRIEANGIRIDTDTLNKQIESISIDIKRREEEMKKDDLYDLWKDRFLEKTTLGSGDQLSAILYEDLKLVYPSESRTGTGKWETTEEVLAKVDHPFVDKYLQVKKLRKLSGTFLKGLLRETVNGFVHPFFHLHTVKTYRGSSSDVNFTNLPKRDKGSGEIVRSCFISRSDKYCLVEVDFSGIEVRVAACYHKDSNMLDYINDPTKDMHRDMAADCYLIKPDQVSKDARQAAKNKFVFPQFYGDFYVNCARALWKDMMDQKIKSADGSFALYKHLKKKGVKKRGDCNPNKKSEPHTFERHIQDVEKDFWNNRFPEYTSWKKDWFRLYQKQGGVNTLTGFCIKGIYSRNQIINYPIQGSAFHCLLWSIITLQKWLTKNKMKTKIVGQIHDSMILDIYKSELQDVLNKVKEITHDTLREHWDWIIVPMETEVVVSPFGGNWFEGKQWKEKNGKWSEFKKETK